MEHFIANQAQYWATIGVVLLIIDMALLGMASGVLLFAGVGALLTGGVMWLGIFPPTLLTGIAVFATLTTISGVLLWPQLCKLQGEGDDPKEQRSDFIGQVLILDHDLSDAGPVSQRFSGVTWQLFLDVSAAGESISAGQRVVIVAADVGKLTVKPVSVES